MAGKHKKGKGSVGSKDNAGPEALPLFSALGESALPPGDQPIDGALSNGSAGNHNAKEHLGRSENDVPPWASVDPREKAHYSFVMPKEYDLMMEWICDTLPRMSKRRLIRDAVRIYVDALIAKYYGTRETHS
ncbi:hypothetical protein CIC12_03625 [Burkholderia sp. SG-MS1]|uniref:hypothetical protein n=1 Tax=Paraburkholderia sp. SG-MS1 TaxID=2023741 RepID=UPI00144598F4|nr:hypothetical protein [Paraburkholderia sp. SG-MS1]NKJ45846.1 hypothetical protein [Paraburkholderia sp. SG-MS1]